MHRSSLLLSLSICVASTLGCAPDAAPPPAISPLAAQAHSTDALSVCQVGGESLLGDLVRPGRAVHKRRALLLVHGGGWRGGERQEFAPLMQALAQEGYTSLSVDYRLAPAVRHPAQLTDVKCALRWLKAHAAELDIDPDRVALLGSSAGGHLATLAAYTSNDPQFEGRGLPLHGDTRVAAVVTHGGPADLRDAASYGEDARRAVGVLMGRVPLTLSELERASPVHFVRPDSPPTLVLHGELDATVPVSQAHRLAGALLAANAPHRLLVVPGAGHRDFGPNPDAVRRQLVDFLDTHLR